MSWTGPEIGTFLPSAAPSKNVAVKESLCSQNLFQDMKETTDCCHKCDPIM